MCTDTYTYAEYYIYIYTPMNVYKCVYVCMYVHLCVNGR